ALCQDGERKAADGHRDDIDIARVVDVYFTSRDIFLAGLTDRGLADVSAA
ncbi:MAG: hypothetical protein H5U18_07955, partial [Rhodobacteraceae bacterium]|nr:hypothetical protein [Paracoccaceae bacterium]